MTTEWDAAAYHRVSDPQFAWGVRVLDRLAPDGGESVVDAGCGSGRLTARLAARLPRGRVIALDRSRAMLATARETLRRVTGPQVHFVLADLARLPLRDAADAVFSNATFHWVLDHEALFSGIRAALRPGGRLVAQCGGEGNLDRIHERANAMIGSPGWERWFGGWSEPWKFAAPGVTRTRLERAGFVAVDTWLQHTPTSFSTADEFAAFVTAVVARPFLARLPDEATRQDFVATLTRQAGNDDPPYTLDYVRLNIEARRP
jgi:trans-aconitate methyltransferase